MAKLTEKQQIEIVGTASGSGDGPERAGMMLEELSYERNYLDELMADWGYEMCPGCGWYQPAYEFLDEESNIFEDEACRECNDYNPDAEEEDTWRIRR